MSRVTRRQIRSWLAPMRRVLSELRSGEVDSINGRAITALGGVGEFARMDHCFEGFKSLLGRLCANLDLSPMDRVGRKLAGMELLTAAEIDACFALMSQAEDLLIRIPREQIRSAVLTESIAIELDK